MNSTAYLVGVIDTSTHPPKFLGAGYFSESTPTFCGCRWSFVIAETSAPTYEEAERKLKECVRINPGLEWVRDCIQER